MNRRCKSWNNQTSNPIDLIILDLNIPKMSGYAVLALNPQKKKTPVIVFSAAESEEDVNRSFALGAREFIHKPMDHRSIVSSRRIC